MIPYHNRKQIEGMLPTSPLIFGKIVSVDPDERLVKVELEPWGNETGWCRCLKDTFYPIESGTGIYEPRFPYKSGQEVLVAQVQGTNGSGQYVVLGLIDQGEVAEQ
ncbi:hypothetical protein [Brevibacillus massiliensis]|uniref:hypothetical protein n=1 Tax=Brevibacillus massiliensis TaxID=1118054 RepID=UPI0003677357|nr:hypothetical protein [Brevibacillus massiliensis]